VFIWEPIIQEQGLVIFFNCAAIYFASYSIFKKQNKSFLFLSGIFFACAYYSRQTGLAPFISLFFFILFFEKFRILKIVKKYYLIILGFFTIASLFFIFYLQYMSITDLFVTNINPFYLLIVSFKHIITNVTLNNSVEQGNFNLGLQDISTTKKLFSATVQYNYVLIISFIVLLMILFLQMIWPKQRNKNEIHKMLFFMFWSLITALFYVYHYFYRGFFPQYIREFQIPLVVTFAFLVFYFVRKSIEDDRILSWIIFTFGVSISLGLLYHFVIKSYPSKIFTVVLCSIFFTLIILFKQFKKSKKIKIPKFEKWLFWGLLMLITGVFIYTFSNCGRFLSIHYQAIWSPKVIDKVVSYINANSDETDGVLAGSPIWAIESSRSIVPPYSHPMIFKEGISAEINQEILNIFRNDPPKIVVVDKYTREVFFDCFHWMEKIVKKYYLLQASYSELEYEIIEVYKLKKEVYNKTIAISISE